MITFKQYLAESERYTPISEDLPKLLEFIEKHCSDAMWMVRDDRPLWRGTKSVRTASVVDPTLSERKSQGLSNHYTVIMDNSPYMRDYPKRSRSLIAATEIDVAAKFAPDSWSSDETAANRPYAIIPFNHVPIGIVGQRDLWDHRVKLFNVTLNFDSVARRLSWIVPEAKIESFQKIDAELKAGNKSLVRKFTDEFPGATKEHQENFLESIYHSLSPKEVGFQLATTADKSKLKNDTEVWIGGKCVVIPHSVWEKLIEYAREK